MNRAFFALSALSGGAAVAVILLTVQAFRAPAAHVGGAVRVEQIVGLVMLALGAVVFGSSAFMTGGDVSGPWLLPPAVLLAATGILAWLRPDVASRLLLWGAAAVVPLTFVIGLAVSAANPGRPGSATFSNALGAVGFVLFFAVPAAITGVLLRLAGRERHSANQHSRDAGSSRYA